MYRILEKLGLRSSEIEDETEDHAYQETPAWVLDWSGLFGSRYNASEPRPAVVRPQTAHDFYREMDMNRNIVVLPKR